MTKQKKQFQIPEQLLRSLDECSSGGFLLFSFDENGAPDIHAIFDNPAYSLAMQQFVKNWITAVEETHLDLTKQQMLVGSRKK